MEKQGSVAGAQWTGGTKEISKVGVSNQAWLPHTMLCPADCAGNYTEFMSGRQGWSWVPSPSEGYKASPCSLNRLPVKKKKSASVDIIYVNSNISQRSSGANPNT